MAIHRIRSSVAKFVVVTSLAATLLAGSTALLAPMDASAMPSNCELVDYYANKYLAARDAGYYAQAYYYFNLMLKYAQYC
jgi:hypothetical protein